MIWEGRCIVVVGAGVSAADYLLWADLIAILQERCGLRAEDLLSTKPLDVAQAAKDKAPTQHQLVCVLLHRDLLAQHASTAEQFCSELHGSM